MSERSEQVEPMNTEELASEYVLGTLDAAQRAGSRAGAVAPLAGQGGGD